MLKEQNVNDSFFHNLSEMPELPEVETVRRQLEAEILDRTLVGLDIRNPVVIKTSSSELAEFVQGKIFKKISRKGKLLIFHFENSDKLLHAHLKMTGQFLFQEKDTVSAGVFPLLYASTPGGKKTVGRFKEDQVKEGLNMKHTHLIFHFEDGSQLAFRDQRRFGFLKLVEKEAHQSFLERYGIDPLYEEFTEENFILAFRNRKKSLKAVLMDQQIIAGIGNIYADEICHRAGLRPQRSVRRITKAKKVELFKHTQSIIQGALASNGTTFKDFSTLDGGKGNFSYQLKVYGRENADCETCESGTIQKEKYLGRGTHYCSNCQS